MKTKIKVDDKVCIGSGSCIILASEFFELNSEGKAEIKTLKEKKSGKEMILDLNLKDRKKILEAAKACPTQAITLVDETGKKIYP